LVGQVKEGAGQSSMNIEKFTVSTAGLDTTGLLRDWQWLIGEEKEILLITKMGDLLLRDCDDAIYMLSASEGSIEHLSTNSRDFYSNRLSALQYLELFQPELIADLEIPGNMLKAGQVYTFLKLPVLGGEKTAENVRRIDLRKHFSLLGEIHRQMDEKNNEQRTANPL
jgi:hypothetical protein